MDNKTPVACKDRVFIKPGQFGRLIVPHSEVCMYMRVAGKDMKFQLLDKQYPSVQLIRDDGTLFSSPITTGEGGVYTEGDRYYYYPIKEPENVIDRDAWNRMQKEHPDLKDWNQNWLDENKFRSTFRSRHLQYAHRIGQKFTVLRELTDDDVDLKITGRMFLIQFEDGVVIQAFKEEVLADEEPPY